MNKIDIFYRGRIWPWNVRWKYETCAYW